MNKKWILIVEDDEEQAQILGENLINEGFEIQICSRNSEAMNKMSKQKYACVLLDLNLGQESSELSIFAMRANKTNLNYYTPAIVISGGLDASVVQNMKNKVSDFFVKPYDFKNLVAKIDSLIEISETTLRNR